MDARRAWGCSSVGRAPPLHGGSQGFESPQLQTQMKALWEWATGTTPVTCQVPFPQHSGPGLPWLDSPTRERESQHTERAAAVRHVPFRELPIRRTEVCTLLNAALNPASAASSLRPKERAARASFAIGTLPQCQGVWERQPLAHSPESFHRMPLQIHITTVRASQAPQNPREQR